MPCLCLRPGSLVRLCLYISFSGVKLGYISSFRVKRRLQLCRTMARSGFPYYFSLSAIGLRPRSVAKYVHHLFLFMMDQIFALMFCCRSRLWPLLFCDEVWSPFVLFFKFRTTPLFLNDKNILYFSFFCYGGFLSCFFF